MSGSVVAIVGCESYNVDVVEKSVERGIALLGGINGFIKPGEKIVLKPNVLLGSKPDTCITTHPSVFKATGKLLQKAGIRVHYGDSSAIGRCEGNMRRSGLKEIGDDYGFVLADFDTGRQVFHKDALLVKSFTIASGVIDADGLISLPKLKTHGLTRITGAIKNQFGCIPGMMKSQFHLKLPDPYDFATMLVDINTFIKPRLYIMDAVMAMEGNGPRNGKPRKLGVLLFSSDPVAVDAVACLLINLNPEFVPTSKPGELSGLGTYHNDNIEIVGDELNAFIVKDFEVERSAPVHCTTGGLTKFIKNQICERPVIDKTKCTVCGTCVKMCPAVPKAIDWHTGKKDKPPFYKYEQCIRCFCCQEVCPEGAISVYKPALAKVMSRPFSI